MGTAHLKTNRIALIAVLTLLGVTACVLGLSYYTLFFPNEATVASEAKIEIFIDPEHTSELANGTTIDWGTVNLGSNTKTYWIKNIGNCDVVLSLTTSTMPSGWTISWDYDETVITPNETRQVTLTLTVPTEAPAATYSWDSWITADET